MKTTERNQSIELLRIILMVLIIFWHLLFHGIGPFSTDGSFNTTTFLYPLIVFHVDTFIFISGYYGIRLKWNRFAQLLTKMVFYSCIATLLLVIHNTQEWALTDIIKNIFPISGNVWWFMQQYLYLMLLSPFLNIGMEKLHKKEVLMVIIVLYLLSTRITEVLLIFIYLIGRYMRKYPVEIIERKPLSLFFGVVSLSLILSSFCLLHGKYPNFLYDNLSLFVIASSITLFYVFKKITIHNKLIGIFSSGVLAAYLITDYSIYRTTFVTTILDKVGNGCGELLLCSILIVLALSLFDFTISRFCGFIIQTIKQWI